MSGLNFLLRFLLSSRGLTVVFIGLLLLGGSQWASHYPAEMKLPYTDTQLVIREALRLFFAMPPEPGTVYTYATLFYASLFTLTHSFSTIVLLPGIWLVFIIVSSFFLYNRYPEKLVIVSMVATFYVLYTPVLSALPWGLYSIEALCFVLTLGALLLFWHGCQSFLTPYWPSLILALFLLGTVTALQMLTFLSGLLWIFYSFYLYAGQHFKPVIFRLSLLGSLIIIPWSQSVHNGSWLPTQELTLFIQAFSAPSGLLMRLAQSLNQTIMLAQQPVFVVLCLLLYGLGQLLAWQQGLHKTLCWREHTLAAGLLLLVFFSPFTQNYPDTFLPLMILLVVLILAIYRRITLIFLLLGLYLGALLSEAVLSYETSAAMSATYTFAVYLVLPLWLLQPIFFSHQPAQGRDENPGDMIHPAFPPVTVIGVQGCLLSFLFFGVYCVPSALKTAFQSPAPPSTIAAIKIMENRLIDRALYFNQQGQLFLTRTDAYSLQTPIYSQQLVTYPAPIEFTQRAVSLTADELFYIASLYHPFSFVNVVPSKD